ncbi:MAG: hypothetical protein JNL98_30880 [Bryobacterales bacterium]|nr:hypothetical protein [Bryobacterales bacterium]
MADSFKIFALHIEGVNLDNVPLHEVGEYIADLAHLLGKDVDPKFAGVTKGSINVRAKVPVEHEMDVRNRGFALRVGDAPDEAERAKQRISQRLGKHRAKRATLVDAKNNRVIEIPVMKISTETLNLPLLQQKGSLQGQVIRVGGRKDPVSVEIQDVDDYIYPCRASREIAKRLAREIFGSTVRVYGIGKIRSEGTVWRVEEFHIDRFEVLEDKPLEAVLDEIRDIPSEWKNRDDVLEELERIRHGE